MDPIVWQTVRMDWTTPLPLFRALDAEFHFTLDAAASPDNALCAQYYTAAEDALQQPWPGIVWCNPPYGRQVGRWVAKGWQEAYTGVARQVVVLIAARTDTVWWQEYVMRGAEIRFVRGRVRFGGAPNAAPFPSAVVVFDPAVTAPVRMRSWVAPRA